VRVVRLTKPEALLLPEIRRLFQLSLQDGAKNPDRSINKIAASLANPNLRVFIGLEGGKPRGQITVYLPADPLTDWPTFDLGANEGSLALGRALVTAGVEFLRASGYNQAWTFNFSGHSDKVWIRGASKFGVKVKPRCTMMTVEF
jgi:hypothetical protein